MKVSCHALTVALLAASVDAFTVPQQRLTSKAFVASKSLLFAATEPKTINEDLSVDAFKEVVDKLDANVTEAVASVVKSDEDAKAMKALEEDLNELVAAVETEAELAVQELVDDECEIDDEGLPIDEVCLDEEEKQGIRSRLKGTISKLLGGLSSDSSEFAPDIAEGETLEKGWEQRGNSSALRRNAEIWKFAFQSVFRALKSRKLKKKGASDEEVKAAQIEAAEFIRDGLLTLGPTFVKLGQVISTRTDVLPATYTDTLKTLQDEVPGFSGERAKQIVSEELGKPFDQVFTDFSAEPLKAASLGQVHTAQYKGKKVAIKVQRAGLKELFDVDLKNLKKLASLLDKFDPKSDGADRDWVSIYEESERLLYLEIDYLNEATNAEKFAKDFKDIDYVRVPDVYREVSTPRVLTMEFVESLKLTDIEKIEKLGLDKQLLAKRTADAFLRQIVETSYFHCDPHPGKQAFDGMETATLLFFLILYHCFVIR